MSVRQETKIIFTGNTIVQCDACNMNLKTHTAIIISEKSFDFCEDCVDQLINRLEWLRHTFPTRIKLKKEG